MNGNHYHLPEQKAPIKISTMRGKKKKKAFNSLWEALPFEDELPDVCSLV